MNVQDVMVVKLAALNQLNLVMDAAEIVVLRRGRGLETSRVVTLAVAMGWSLLTVLHSTAGHHAVSQDVTNVTISKMVTVINSVNNSLSTS